VAEATALIQTVTVVEAAAQMPDADPIDGGAIYTGTIFVDVRCENELWRTGILAGAVNVPRGMLEFVIDPNSPYHNPIFSADNRFIFYCASGIRSALAAQRAQEMGIRVAHLKGGLKAWKDAGYPVAPYRKQWAFDEVTREGCA
jgi:rhodanese-related sulfurtransferase